MGGVTVAAVNRELARRGVSERLVSGRGYFYFYGGDAASWHGASVFVYSVNQLTIDQWLDEWKRLSRRDVFPND